MSNLGDIITLDLYMKKKKFRLIYEKELFIHVNFIDKIWVFSY